jgi:hypothetical protein
MKLYEEFKLYENLWEDSTEEADDKWVVVSADGTYAVKPGHEKEYAIKACGGKDIGAMKFLTNDLDEAGVFTKAAAEKQLVWYKNYYESDDFYIKNFAEIKK